MNNISLNKKDVQRNMIFNTVGSLIYYACQWLMTVLIVRISGYENAGVLSIAMSVTSAPAIIGLFNIRNYQVSDLEGQFSDTVYIRSRRYTNILSFIICCIMVISGKYSLNKVLVILTFMIFKMSEGLADVYYGIEQKKERMDYVGISLTIRGIGTIVLFLMGLFVSDSLIVSILMISAFSFSFVYFYDRRIVKQWMNKEKKVVKDKKVEKQAVIKLLQICLPLAIVAFLNNLSLSIPKIYLEKYYGSEVLGVYSSIASPTMVVQLAATTMFAPLIPILSLCFQGKNKKGFLGILKKFILIILGFSIICIIGAKILGCWGLTLLFSDSIEPYVWLFVPIVIVSILIALNASLFSVCTIVREIKSQYIIGVTGVIAALGLSAWVTKELSMIGVVYTLIGTLGIQILVQLLIIWKKMRKCVWEDEDKS